MTPAARRAHSVLLMFWMTAAVPPDRLPAETWSLVSDFSAVPNSAKSTWSFRLDDGDGESSTFPLLMRNDRDANQVWGSDFANPPKMWCEESSYWGIGKNVTGEELFSSRNDTTWLAGEVLLHPKTGDTPDGLVICWTAPHGVSIDIRDRFSSESPHGNGVGYSLLHRSRGGDADIVGLKNIGTVDTEV